MLYCIDGICQGFPNHIIVLLEVTVSDILQVFLQVAQVVVLQVRYRPSLLGSDNGNGIGSS